MQEKYFIDFTGGFNDTVPQDNLAPNEMTICENAIVSKTRGGILKRPGCTKVNYQGISYNGIVTQIYEASNKYYKRLHAIIKEDNEYTLYNISADNVKYPIKSGIGPKIAQVCYKNKLYFIDIENNKFYEYDLLAIQPQIVEVTPDPDPTNNLTPIKRCKFLMWHPQSGRFFAAGDSEDPTALYYSEIGKINYFKSTNTRYPITSAGAIMGLRFIDDSILVAYQDGWYHFTDSVFREDMTFKPLPIPFGLSSSDGACLTPETLTFLSDEALYIFSPSVLNDKYFKVVGESSFVDISSSKIKKTIIEMVNHKTKIIYHDKCVFIAYTTDWDKDYCDQVLVMNWDTKSFVKFTGWKVYDWCVHNGYLHIATENYILKYDHTGQVLNDVDTVTGDKKAIVMRIYTKAYNLDSYHNKTIHEVFVSSEHKTTLLETLMTLVPDNNHSDENIVNFKIKNDMDGWVSPMYVNSKAQINKTGTRHTVHIYDENLDNYLFIAVIGFIYEYLTDTANEEATQDLLISD